MFTREELLAAAGATAQVVGGELAPLLSGGAVDSRQARRGELFVALPGERTDGHRFIGAAIRNGAAAILCAHADTSDEARGTPQVVVPDPLVTLQTLAGAVLRRQPQTRVIAVAGSNGKTTTKEAIGTLLAHLAPTLKTEGNLNTETGLPLTLLRLEPHHEYAVLEMGAQRVGEVELLCRIAPPQIAVVTVIGPEHLEFFGSLEQVIAGESEVVRALTAENIAILNADDPHVRGMAALTSARVLLYGRASDAEVRAEEVAGNPLAGVSFTLVTPEGRAPVQLQLPGSHAVTTALAAAAVALTCGMPLPAVAAVLAEIRPARQRGEIKRALGGCTLVDDSYNANRQSALAAVALLREAQVAKGGRRWLIFGDMLELGAYAPEEHAAVGRETIGAVDELVLVGEDVQATAEAARSAGMPPERIHLYAAPLRDAAALAVARDQAARFVANALQPGDIILVKGSLGVGMASIVAALVADPADVSSPAH